MGTLKSQFRHLELHLAILADGKARGVPFNSLDSQQLTSRFSTEGSSFFNVTLPSLGRAVDIGLVSGQFTLPVSFRALKGTRLPTLFNEVFLTVFDRDGNLLEQPNVTAIFFLRQVCLLQSKLLTEPTKIQTDKTIESFIQGQRALRRIRLNVDDPVLRIAQAILGYVLKGLSLSRITPGHGPGAVHEKRDPEERWDFTYWPKRANSCYPFYEYGVQSLDHLRAKSNKVLYLSDMTTRLAFVPKDFRGPRLISVEMSAMQYLQQGQMRKMMDYIDSHPLLRQSIRMRDQTRNQIMASKSYENGLATLDLSNASDTVSLPLFWFLFAKVPKLRRYLCRTRSQYATYGGISVRLCAMSPMGSAVCFPIETLIFWSLSLATMYRLSDCDRVVLDRRALFELSSNLAVFGDDIIIPEIYLQSLVSTLSSVGCSPNMSKTCWRTPFRESCGTEWFAGIPVSITRNKKVGLDEYDKSDQLPGYIDLQRRFYVSGLYATAKLVSTWCSKLAPVVCQYVPQDYGVHPTYSWQTFNLYVSSWQEDLARVPLGTRAEVQLLSRFVPCILCDVGQFDPRLKVRWNQHLHRIEFRSLRYCQISREWRREGYERLLARLLFVTTDRIAIRGYRIKSCWVPFPSGSWSFMTRSIRKLPS